MTALEIIQNIRQQLDVLEAQLKQPPSLKVAGTSLAALNLSTRAKRCLERIGVTTIEEALALDMDKLTRVEGIGKAVQREIEEKLEAYKQQ